MIRVSTVDESNAEVVWRVHDLLADEQGLRTTTADIEIVGGDRSVVLQGRVRTNILYEMADRLARTGAGVWPVDNRLINDEALAMQISTRVGLDPRTADANVRTDVYLGVAHLAGTVQSGEQRQAVLALAGATPDVVRVEDRLAVAR